MRVNEDGIISSLKGRHPEGGFQVRETAWYNTTRYAQKPVWVDPFVSREGDMEDDPKPLYLKNLNL